MPTKSSRPAPHDTSLLGRARRAAGMTQQQVADRWCAVWPDEPKTAKAIHYWEKGIRAPSLATIERLARILGCRVMELTDPDAPAPLAVAIAVVVRGPDVLLVHNRDTGRWQFPAGHVKPGRDAGVSAARECRAETGVHADPEQALGSRIHPRSRALCHYVACAYLAGEPVNADPDENIDVAWAPIASLARFVALDDVYAPVLAHLDLSPHGAAA